MENKKSTIAEIVSRRLSEAPVNVEGLIEEIGLRLKRKAALHPQIAGQIQRCDDGVFEISANENDHYYRRRFTMAHELAHYIFHRSLIGSGVNDTVAYRSMDVGTFNNTNISAEHEIEANKAAAKILMPSPLVRRYHTEYKGDIARMANKFKVSKEAMGYRLQGLGLQSE